MAISNTQVLLTIQTGEAIALSSQPAPRESAATAKDTTGRMRGDVTWEAPPILYLYNMNIIERRNQVMLMMSGINNMKTFH